VAHGDQPVDETLHSERTDHAGAKRTHRNTIDVLPDATFIRLEDSAWLIFGERLLKWSPGGYVEHQPRMQHVEVEVLTPLSTVAVLRLAYRPVLPRLAHSSQQYCSWTRPPLNKRMLY